ncbi:signal peptidase I SipW [Virgibacillus sp. M23]|uniref:signal peptidase I SipW n=1 Tax=Virgibacillus sp. M23 TaxID=3079030 RepID=UPI0039C5CA81
MKKLIHLLRKFMSCLLIAMIIIFAFAVITSKVKGEESTIFGYQIKSVLSGSMEPTFQTGSIIAIKPGTEQSMYKKGDVITFRTKEEKMITHRIVEVKQAEEQQVYTTKGDNNDGVDVEPVLTQNIIGEYTGFTVPYVGYLLNFAKSKVGTAVLLIVPGVILLLYGLFSMFQAIRGIEDPKKEQPT